MRATQGVSIVEIMMVVAIMGILAGILSSSLRTPSATIFANDLQATILQGRFEAIKRNAAVAVIWSSTSNAFEMHANTGAGVSCTFTGSPIKAVSPGDYKSLSVKTGASFGILWIPSGIPRSCGAGSVKATLSKRS